MLKLVSAVIGERVGVASEANKVKLNLFALSRGPFVPVSNEGGIVDCLKYIIEVSEVSGLQQQMSEPRTSDPLASFSTRALLAATL